jgi:hypothetical protein
MKKIMLILVALCFISTSVSWAWELSKKDAMTIKKTALYCCTTAYSSGYLSGNNGGYEQAVYLAPEVLWGNSDAKKNFHKLWGDFDRDNGNLFKGYWKWCATLGAQDREVNIKGKSRRKYVNGLDNAMGGRAVPGWWNGKQSVNLNNND